MTVIWKKNGLRLWVLGTKEGKQGELRYLVCKDTAPNPAMGTFSVRIEDVEAEFK